MNSTVVSTGRKGAKKPATTPVRSSRSSHRQLSSVMPQANGPDNGIRIAILDDFQNVAMSSAEQAWATVRANSRTKGNIAIQVFTSAIPTSELASMLQPFDIICTMRDRTPFPASLLTALPKLKLLTTTGPVNRSIDTEVAKSRGVIVAGTGATGNATVEHIWGLLLAAARNIPAYDRGVKNPKAPWQSLGFSPSRLLPTGLMGKTIGLVGFGLLGAAVAKIADGFGMNVIAWSQHLTADCLTPEQQYYVSIVSKQELFETADFVSVHLTASPHAHGVITAADLHMMKPTAFFINTSRGPIVDEDALIDLVKSGRIRGAAVDVFEKEPLPADSPWRGLGDRVVLTPHVGYVEARNYEKFWEDTAWNVDVWLDGRDDYIYRLA